VLGVLAWVALGLVEMTAEFLNSCASVQEVRHEVKVKEQGGGLGGGGGSMMLKTMTTIVEGNDDEKS
jgi:hypothetical protein